MSDDDLLLLLTVVVFVIILNNLMMINATIVDYHGTIGRRDYRSHVLLLLHHVCCLLLLLLLIRLIRMRGLNNGWLDIVKHLLHLELRG